MIIKQISYNEAFERAKNGEGALFVLSTPADLNKARVKTIKQMTIAELNDRKAEGHICFMLEEGEYEES